MTSSRKNISKFENIITQPIKWNSGYDKLQFNFTGEEQSFAFIIFKSSSSSKPPMAYDTSFAYIFAKW